MTKKQKPIQDSLERGFTLMETVVAVGIILAGLVGVLILFGQSARSIRVAEDRLVASHLAQEAIEVIVAIRDTNWLSGLGWRTGIPSTNEGIVDYNSTSITTTSDPSRYCLSIVDDIYQHVSGSCSTIFNRHVEIIDRSETIGTSSVPFIEVRAVVEWSRHGQTRGVTVVDHLYNWK